MKWLKIALALISAVLVVLVSIWAIYDMEIKEINLKLFTVCLVSGWVLTTLFDIDQAGNKVLTDREQWKQTKGGVKPMIKWPILVLRSLLLLIVCLLINHVVPDIYAKLIGS